MDAQSLINEGLKNTILNNQPGTFFRRRNDEKQTFLKVSKNWETLIGYSKEDAIFNYSFHETIYLEDRDMVFQRINESIERKEQWNFSYRIQTKSGATKLVEEYGMPIYDENNALLFLDGYISEIVDKNFEIHQELAFKNAINSASIVSKTDINGNIISVNDLFCKWSKYSLDELIGQNHRIINSNYHSKEFFEDMWKTILSKKVWRGEIKNRAKDGTNYWVDTVISPIFDCQGEIKQFLSIRNIITEKKQNELLLRSIYNGLTVKTGEMFFSNLTTFCSKTFNVSHCFVGWFNEIDATVETISFHNDGIELENMIYVLENTPCKNVRNRNIVIINKNIQSEYPENQELVRLNIESYLGIPITNDSDKVLGVLVLMDKKPMLDAFDKEFILSAVSNRIGNELSKFLAEKDKTQYEQFTQNLLSSLGAQICVMHDTGEVLFVNKAWNNFSLANGQVDLRITGVGSNYLEVLGKTIKHTGDIIAMEVYNGIEGIFNDQINNFQLEYPCHAPDKERYFLLNVARFADSTDKLVLSHVEITKYKKLSE